MFPLTIKVSPRAPNAPKLCPAAPLKFNSKVSFGRPFAPYNLEISLLTIVPTVLSVFLISYERFILTFFSIANLASLSMVKSKTFSKLWSCEVLFFKGVFSGTLGLYKILDKLIPLVL